MGESAPQLCNPGTWLRYQAFCISLIRRFGGDPCPDRRTRSVRRRIGVHDERGAIGLARTRRCLLGDAIKLVSLSRPGTALARAPRRR